MKNFKNILTGIVTTFMLCVTEDVDILCDLVQWLGKVTNDYISMIVVFTVFIMIGDKIAAIICMKVDRLIDHFKTEEPEEPVKAYWFTTKELATK